MILLDSVPTLSPSILSAIESYAQAARLSPQRVIEFALVQFLEQEHQSHDAAAVQAAIEQYAAETELPVEMVVELAIAHFLDPDAVTFDDCVLGIQRPQLEQLKQYREAQRSQAA